MTVADDVMRALRTRPRGLTDAELAALLRKRHQHINQTCRTLADRGLITRNDAYGGIINKASGVTPERQAREPRPPSASTAEEWIWEGNVQSRLVTHLAKTGWNIIAVANTAQRERGVDIIAERDGRRMLVEVKGWPSTTYARGERAGQPKPTAPSMQATHWFAELLTSLIRRGAEGESTLAMGLPDVPRYRNLLGEAAWALERLDITIYLVTADGAVRVWEREN
jgi:hypothetical protein